MIRTYDFNNYKDKKQISIVGRERILVWPCNLYRVTLPRIDHTNDKEFNFFEWCILKMLAYHRYEPKDLAEETCLPEDLIEVILLRLFDLLLAFLLDQIRLMRIFSLLSGGRGNEKKCYIQE